MKLWASGLLLSTLVFAIGSSHADDNLKKLGKTVKNGANGVGHGLSKVYHDSARGVHKVIAKNTHDPHERAVHMHKAKAQHHKAARQEHHATHDMKSAKKAAHYRGQKKEVIERRRSG